MIKTHYWPNKLTQYQQQLELKTKQIKNENKTKYMKNQAKKIYIKRGKQLMNLEKCNISERK